MSCSSGSCTDPWSPREPWSPGVAAWGSGDLGRVQGVLAEVQQELFGVQGCQAGCRQTVWNAEGLVGVQRTWLGYTWPDWGSGGPGRVQGLWLWFRVAKQAAGSQAGIQDSQTGHRWEPNVAARGRFDLTTLPVDFVECLMRFLPTEAEAKALRQYERERKPLEELADEDRFMLQFSKVERLPQRMAIMAFLGNFAENIQMLTPQLNAIIAASASVKSSQKLKHMLEIILALGNYMNSSKRGAVYGFKLQSLDLLLDTKSTDRKMTLLHFIALTVREKYPELATFWQELHFVEKAAAVSLENVLLDVKELGRGMELLRRECGQHESAVLRGFLGGSEGQLERLQRDARTAEDAYNTVVRYFGESPKTTPPSVFFPVFVRFIHSYKDAEQENETRKKQEEVMREKLLAQEAKKQEKRNKWQQQELIAELRRRQAKDHRPMYEGKDGTIEDIITALKSVPFTARTAKRGSRFFCDPSHHDESSC
ncbi:formin-like protein 3 [Cyanistes caeruleus]|uniref:formin-like protein 3 n=1 Tax=Cyanistes caeruleus TaxID=156563 RepID=UPI000CDA6B5B|nr:formin-like protein 3 [Cyanistes caeruleus]